MLKSRITRIIAGIIGCIIAFLCTVHCVALYLQNDSFYNSRDYSLHSQTQTEISELSEKLLLAGYMYLNNLDNNGDYKGTKYAEEQTISILQKQGIMNEKKELDIGEYKNLEYRVTINGKDFSNTDKSHDMLLEKYFYQKRNGALNSSNYFGIWQDFNWFTTNYGMTYYYINGRGYAIFDYDTKDCNSYVDELGARIYFKLDGTTPIPDGYVDFSGYESEENNMANNRESSIVSNFDESIFAKNQESEDDITITISPSADLIADIEKWENEAKKIEAYKTESIIKFIPFLAVAFIMVIFILISGGYSKKENKFVLTAFDKIFVELPIIIGAVAVGTSAFLVAIIDEVYNSNFSIETFCIYYGIAGAVLFGIILFMLNTIVIRLKCHSLIKTSLAYRILHQIWKFAKRIYIKINNNRVSRDMVRNDVFTRNFLFRTGTFLIIGLVTGLICCAIESAILLIICEIIVLASYIYISLADFKALERLNAHITAIKFGDYSPRKELTDSPIFTHTEKLNNISAGIQETVENQVKSERMKIELVTNVSHDLKTPLTSIISYIDLLSTEELSPVARDYVTVIENKSQRLKSMVADLFDLAKATSNTDILSEEIDAVVLTNQVIGDMGDKIEASGKNFVCDIQADSAHINAEGKKMYRVFQNIIDNALKYSMDGTRIFLTLKKDNGFCTISVKNIASYEMTFNPDEITERFTRGDESRTTEGNGLGLSIAKSFTEACGGKFTVVIDGDVFTAIIELPVIE